jgi:SAM-dependent methyltransferase
MLSRLEKFVGKTPARVSYLLQDLGMMAAARNYFAWQYRLAARDLGQRVVEVGCGNGNFTGLLLDRTSVIAVDTEASCVERVQERYPDRSNLHVERCGPPEAAFLNLRRFEPDSCVCLNVIEHIADDIGALSAMGSILPPGGTIVLLAPAFEALYGPIDYQLGHYRRYTRGTLVAAGRAAGLDVVRARYMNLPGFFGWWANARVFGRKAQSSAQIAFFDRFIVPVASRMEQLAAPPFGQSILVTFRKGRNLRTYGTK